MRIALVGMSTTGKSALAEACKIDSSGPLAGYDVIDSDSWVAEKILGDSKKPGIARVFLEKGRDQALKLIEQQENKFLEEFKALKDNRLFALGPNTVLRGNWSEFQKTVTVVLLEKDPAQIIDGLAYRRTKLEQEFADSEFSGLSKHKDFGCWDTGMVLDENMQKLDDSIAKKNIADHISRMKERLDSSYKTLTCKIHPVSLKPQDLYDVLGMKPGTQ